MDKRHIPPRRISIYSYPVRRNIAAHLNPTKKRDFFKIITAYEN